MMPVIRISENLYTRLSKYAQGFDNPSNVIERLLDLVEGVEPRHIPECEPEPEVDETKERGRLFNNQEIQERISAAARELNDAELAALCDKAKSKEIFDINYPLFVSVPVSSEKETKRNAVKDHTGMNRWSWKHSFERNGYVYAICTQWYERNDRHVKDWLQKHETSR